MLKFLIDRLPETKSVELQKKILSRYDNRQLFERLREMSSIDDFVKAELERLIVSPGSRTRALLARAVAGEVHDRGQRVVKKSCSFPKRKSAKLLIVHPYVWGQELAEQIVSQAWGKLGKRRSWLESDERSATCRFGVDIEFQQLFVSEPEPVYALVEEVDEPLAGQIYRLCE